VIPESIQQLAEGAGQIVLAVLQDLRQALGDVADALRDDDPVFGQQPPDLIGLGSACLHKSLPGPVQRQHRLLAAVLNRHEAHVGAGHRFADRLGVRGIVLVRLDVGFDELRSNQLHRVSQLGEFPRPVVGAPACFHTDQARRQVGEERGHLVALQLLLQHRPAALIHAMHLDHVLCQIDPNRSR